MSGAAIHGLLAGTHVELVGVEDDPRGGLRLYLGHRSKGVYAHIDEPAVMAEIKEAWDGYRQHITVPCPPPDCLFYDHEERAHVG